MINYDLSKIKAVIFDVDGVLSAQTILMDSDGEPMRTINIQDGYAIQLAVKMGLRVVILTGGKTPNIKSRYNYLGVTDIFMKCAVKILTYEELLKKYDLTDEQILYMGDDIPDVPAMEFAGIGVAPADAVEEARQAADIISPVAGGKGFVRWTLELVMKAQGRWIFDVDKYEKMF